MSKLYAYFFTATTVLSIPFLTESQLNRQLEKTNIITVVEFWASWNKSNQVNELSDLKRCEYVRVDIGKEPLLQTKYSVKVVPTLIIYEKGKEKKRFEGNLMFQMCPESFSIKKVQKNIDKLLYNKFE
tara:strand:- start:13361 stop:13744 length:384 start_codon:yes stop_codon:yes gene_type:complete